MPAAAPPLVTCVMPTADRRALVPLAIERFLAQDHPQKEIVVVDDGADPVGDLVERIPGARYVRLPDRASIGHKRNVACEHARGEIIVQWDDDDWYAPDRLRLQIAPILAGEADVTGLVCGLVLELPRGDFWTPSAALHARMFEGDVHGGTLAFRRDLFTAGVRYPDRSLAEDAMFLRRALARGARLRRVEAKEAFVYVRHGHNAWAFDAGRFLDPDGWSRADRPASMDEAQLDAYRRAVQPEAIVVAPPAPVPTTPAPGAPLAIASFREEMGYRIGLLEPGVSSHWDRFRPFLTLPLALSGKAFTQLVSTGVGPVHLEFLGAGRLYVLVAADAPGQAEAAEILSREGRREDMPPLTARRGSTFEVWSIEGAAGRSLTLPAPVMLVTERLSRAEG